MRILILLIMSVLFSCASKQSSSSDVTNDREIAFEKEILILDRKIVVDGKTLQAECHSVPSDFSKMEPFAVLTVDGNTRLKLVCVDDYLGGIALVIPGQKDANYLAQLDGDSSEMWESRSLITKDGGSLHIEKVFVKSHPSNEDDGGDEYECSASATAYQWKNGSFIKVGSAKKLTVKDFQPPIQVSEKCLTDDGRWRAKTH